MTVEEKQSRTTTCADCEQAKPNASFHRLLSLAHSRSVLKQPNLQTRYTATSKFCKECRAKRKRKTPLTTKEIRNKITSGDIHSVKGEIILQQKRDALPQIRARGMKKRWQKVKSAPLKALKKQLQQQVAKYANRYHTYKHQQGGQENATLAQHRYNYSQAKAVRDKVLREAEYQLEQGKPIDVSLDADIGMMINPRFMTQYLLTNEGETQ
jgi:hypothetical protein